MGTLIRLASRVERLEERQARKPGLPLWWELPEGQWHLGAAGVTHDAEIGRVSLVGAGMKTNPGVAAAMFEALAAAGINIEMISTSSIRISCVVRAGDVEDAVRVLHTAFGLDLPDIEE